MGEEASFMLDEGNEGAETETSQKAFRRRKKQLYQSIRKQMEFYFSDSNLTKDRFLGNLLKENPYVDLSIFIRFNRIRALTTDISEIARALRHSELLSVTEDGTKVFRTKPVQQKDNIDECTIYVEQLPPDADHDWLRDVFSAYGNVAYVSIPKYRTSGKIKGFGFVEFETPEEVNKTLEAFGARGCRLSSEIAPDKLCSIATFEEDETTNVDETNQGELSEKEHKKQQMAEKDSSQHKRKRSSSHKESIKDLDNEQVLENEAKSTQTKEQILSEEDVRESSKEGEDCKEENSDVVKRKRTKSQDEKGKFAKKDENEKPEESNPNIKRKRKKHPEEEVEDEEINLDSSKKRRKLIEEDTQEVKVEESTKKKRKKKQEVDALEDQESEDNIASKKIKAEIIEGEDADADQSKKKRKREAEEETRENTTEEDEQVTESRTQYLTEGGEIENVEDESKRKRKRKKKKKNKKDKQDINANSLQILSKREWKRLRNKYLDLQRAKMKCLKQYLNKQYWSNQMQQSNTDIPEPEVKVSQPRISYTSGVIVYAVLDEPITDIRKFKADTKALQYVEYVDISPGANVAYIRCSTAEGAKQLASSNPWVSSAVLKGEEETQYWDKIMADRKVKFSNKIRTKQRGRDKVLRRAERELGKHIKFDE